MTNRYAKLVAVRKAASKIATGAYAHSAAYLTGQEALASRLDDAAAALSPETGIGFGSDLAARAELSTRMQAARRTTQARLDDARSNHEDVASSRHAARRALDAAIEICRVRDRADAARALTKIVPAAPKDAQR